MRIFNNVQFQPVRRDVTVPTSVVYITQIVSTNTAETSLQKSDPTVTVLTTITAGSGSQATAITVSPSLVTYAKTISSPVTSSVSGSNTNSAVSTSMAISSTSTNANFSSNSADTSLLSSNVSSNSSTRLGLAIGIPIAVVSVFGLVVFFLICLRKRMDMKPTEALAFKARRTDASTQKPIAEKQSVSSMYSTSDVEQGPDAKMPNYANYQNRQYAQDNEMKPNFLKRISRLMNVPGSPLEFKSPVFLRRFHLSSNKNEAETISKQKELPKSPLSQIAHNPQNPYETNISRPDAEMPHREASKIPAFPGSTYVVVKPYARRLGDELSVCIGEKVTIVDKHSDGWATVKMVESGDIGVIPLMCIKKVLR